MGLNASALEAIREPSGYVDQLYHAHLYMYSRQSPTHSLDTTRPSDLELFEIPRVAYLSFLLWCYPLVRLHTQNRGR